MVERLAWLQDPPENYVVGNVTPSPVSDGERIYALFGHDVVAAVQLDGKRVWTHRIEGGTRSMDGYEKGKAASPVVSGDLVLVPGGRLVALERKTGKLRWSEEWSDFGSPNLVQVKGEALLVSPSGAVRRVADGSLVAQLPAKLYYATPVTDGTRVYFAGNSSDFERVPLPPIEAKAFDLSTNPPTTLWTAPLPMARYLSSPLLHDGTLHVLGEDGRIVLLSAATGKTLGEHALKQTEGLFYSSAAFAGRWFFFANDAGQLVATEPRPPFAVVATRKVAGLRASPVFAGGELYLRTFEKLHCLTGR